jgi:phage-related protein
MAADKVLRLAFILSATDKMTRVIDEAVKKSTNSLSTFGRNATKAGRSMMKSGAMMVGAGAAIGTAIIGVSKSTADYGNLAAKTARSVGMDAEGFQKLAYAAKYAGVEQQKLSAAMVRFNKNIVDAGQGSGKAAQLFKDMGIKVKDAAGNLRAPNEILADVADKFKEAPDGAMKTAAAYELLGRSGADMISLLNGGAEGLEAMGKEAADMGLVISNDAARASENFVDNLDRVKDSTRGAAFQLGAALMPILNDLAIKIKETIQSVTKWVQENPKLAATISKIAVGVSLLLVTLGTLAMVIGAVSFAIGALTSPIGLVVLAIAAVGIAALIIVKYWNEIAAFFSRLWNRVIQIFKTAWDWIKNMFLNYTPHGLIIKHWDSIVDWFVNLWNKVGAVFSGLGARFYEWGRNMIVGLWNGIKSMVNNLIESVRNIGRKIANTFKSFFGINSPSRLFMSYGVNITQGLTGGLEAGGSAVEQATEGLGVQATRGAEKAMMTNTSNTSHAVNTMGGVSVSYAPNITIQGNMSEDAKQDFVKMLRQHRDEIVDIMRRETQNRERLSFA